MSDFVSFFIRFLPDLMKGAGITLLLTAEGLTAGFVLGLLAAYARLYGSKFWRGLPIGYIELFRGTPLLMQLFIIYYGLPGLGVTFSRELSAFLALGLNSGAYQAEYLRGSILAIAAQTYNPIGAYLAVAVVYLAIVYLLDAFLRWLERTSRISGFDMEGKKA